MYTTTTSHACWKNTLIVLYEIIQTHCYYCYQSNHQPLISPGTFGYTRDPSDPCKPDNANIIVTTRSHTNDTVNEAVQSCQPSQVVRIGGAGNKVVLL